MPPAPQRDRDLAKQHQLLAQLPSVTDKDGARIDQSHRAIIRSQAMVDPYKKQLPQDAHSELPMAESDPVGASTPKMCMNRFRVAPSDIQKRRMETSKKKMNGLQTRPIRPRVFQPAPISRQQLDSGTEKPEDLLSQHLVALTAIPEGDPGRVRALTHHYFQERMKSSQLMLNLRKGYFQLAMQDSAFFSAAISHYAGIFSLVIRDGDPLESLQLRMRSIALVNSRLKESALGVSDGTVGAVASIINYETNNGTPLAVQIHIAGLKAMLRLRGGFLNAGLSPLLQRMVAWAELTSTYFLSDSPKIIPFYNPRLDLPSRTSHIFSFLKSRSRATKLPTPSTYDIDWSTIDKDPASIFADLRFLSYALVSHETEICSIDPLWYSDKIYLIQRSLICLTMDPEPYQTSLDTACYMTASLYVDCRLRDLGARSVAIGTGVSKLRAFLPQVFQELPQDFGLSVSVDRILWVLVFAGIAANGRPERPWLVEKLANMCRILKFESWVELTAILKIILWDEEWEVPRELLWSKVEECLNHRRS
ncbi:hypothetical protein N431DRAFT_481146 [Stipitochalara longipes BDJ]|nr:hypothetical protein N431DRAFT_481146 [Stipitochalara longipes BDJ]